MCHTRGSQQSGHQQSLCKRISASKKVNAHAFHLSSL